MTDIVVHVTQYLPENLSWDLSPDQDAVYVEGGTLDISKFVQAQHFANGFIPSGTVLGVVTATGLLGPYLNSDVSSGLGTAVGILRASIQVVRPDGTVKAKVGCAVMKAFGVVSQAALPFTASPPAGGGAIDSAGITDLAHIHFAA